jgi:hypothetical protein
LVTCKEKKFSTYIIPPVLLLALLLRRLLLVGRHLPAPVLPPQRLVLLPSAQHPALHRCNPKPASTVEINVATKTLVASACSNANVNDCK